MKLFEEITVDDVLDYLGRMVSDKIKKMDIASATKVLVEQSLIKEIAEEITKERGLNR